MKSKALEIPKLLHRLIAKGYWPSSQQEGMNQNTTCLIQLKNIKQFAPEEDSVFFYAPPFSTIAESYKNTPDFWNEHGALNEIDPNLALLIADFGLGSDTSIILDYREKRDDPAVFRLFWGVNNHWEKIADTFDAFAKVCGFPSDND